MVPSFATVGQATVGQATMGQATQGQGTNTGARQLCFEVFEFFSSRPAKSQKLFKPRKLSSHIDISLLILKIYYEKTAFRSGRPEVRSLLSPAQESAADRTPDPGASVLTPELQSGPRSSSPDPGPWSQDLD